MAKPKFIITLHGDTSGWLGEHPTTNGSQALAQARSLAKQEAVARNEPVEAWVHKDDNAGPIQFRTRHVPGVTWD